MGDVVRSSLDQQVPGGIMILIGPPDQLGRIVIGVKDKPARVKGVGGELICQEGQLADIRGEKIIGFGLTAHFGGVHKTGVGDQNRSLRH